MLFLVTIAKTLNWTYGPDCTFNDPLTMSVIHEHTFIDQCTMIVH